MPVSPKNLKIVQNNLPGVRKAIEALGSQRVLVGVPEDKGARKPEGGKPVPITNAALAYIHDNGAPEVNIPQREFLRPGIKSVQGKIVAMFKQAGQLALSGDATAIDRALNAVGLVAQSAVRAKITDGPFAPLALSTIQARARRGRKGAKKALKDIAAGLQPNADDVRPLIDTAQLRAAISYVIRKRGK